jgi:signal transduction histidine kinase
MNVNIDHILARSDLPVFLVDPDGKLVKANASFEALTGLSASQTAGILFKELISWIPQDKPTGKNKSRTKGNGTGPATLKTPQGESLPVHVVELELEGKERGARLVLIYEGSAPAGALTDDLHVARLASLGKVLSGIIHEMSNPLTVIHGSAQLLCSRDLPPEIEEDIHRIRSEAQRTSDLIKKVLSFARKDNRRRERFHVQEVVEEASVLKMCSLKSDKIKIESRHNHGSPLFVYGYKAQLTQVILNLLNNSEQAIREGSGKGMIGVRTDKKSDQALISVSDTGPGIAPQDRRRIFDAFFTTKKEKTGTGLGLYISRKIIQDHGGDLDLTGSSLNETIFQIKLPLWQPESAQDSEPHATGAGLA